MIPFKTEDKRETLTNTSLLVSIQLEASLAGAEEFHLDEVTVLAASAIVGVTGVLLLAEAICTRGLISIVATIIGAITNFLNGDAVLAIIVTVKLGVLFTFNWSCGSCNYKTSKSA